VSPLTPVLWASMAGVCFLAMVLPVWACLVAGMAVLFTLGIARQLLQEKSRKQRELK
jgi:hypothetical protein